MRVRTETLRGVGLGVGLAILGWVGPMVLPTFPQWVLRVLFSGSVVLIVQGLVAPYLLKRIEDHNLKKFILAWMAVVLFVSTYSTILEPDYRDVYRTTKARENNLLRQQAVELAKELRHFHFRIEQEDSRLREDYRQRNLSAKTKSERAKNQKHLLRDSSEMWWRHEDEFEPLRTRAIKIRKVIIENLIVNLSPEKVLALSNPSAEEALRERAPEIRTVW